MPPPPSTTTTTSPSTLRTDLLAALTTSHLTPSATWLTTFLTQTTTPPSSSSTNPNTHPPNNLPHPHPRPPPPLPALSKTAIFRLLASDITQTLDTSPSTPLSFLPPNISDPSTKERRLQGDVVVQVLDAVDVGRAAHEQREELEMEGRGEARGRGRGEVVRAVSIEGEDDMGLGGRGGVNGGAGGGGKRGPWKVLLQDARGGLVWGFEMAPIPNAGVGGREVKAWPDAIGIKLLLRRNALVARGVVLLTPEAVTVLGGRVESFAKAWREGRAAGLQERLRGLGDTGGNAEGDGDGDVEMVG